MAVYLTGVLACLVLAFGYSWWQIKYGAFTQHNWPIMIGISIFSWGGVLMFGLLLIWARRWKRK